MSFIVATELVNTFSSRASASGPPKLTRAMCEMSNSPAAVRTALCSAAMPAYCTGMSQPPNGTMRAL